MTIPVVVVDNEPVDRHLARRRLSRSDGFGDVTEYSSGEDFVRDLFEKRIPNTGRNQKTLVLMDISMPRMDGFQTIEASMKHAEQGLQDVLFVMYTSSTIAFDREVAAGLPHVRGFISKPIDDQDVVDMQKLCAAG